MRITLRKGHWVTLPKPPALGMILSMHGLGFGYRTYVVVRRRGGRLQWREVRLEVAVTAPPRLSRRLGRLARTLRNVAASRD